MSLDAQPEAGELSGVFGGLISAYREREFQLGYEQARKDLLASLVPMTEQYLRKQCQGSAEARRLLYRFIERLEKHIEGAFAESAYVMDGLGI